MPVNVESIESTATPELEMEKKPIIEVMDKTEQPKAPKTIKELEQEEPLLRENAQRFVLFPLKYHEIVRVMSRSLDLFHSSWGRSLAK